MCRILGVARMFHHCPKIRNIHLLFPVLRCLTCGRKCCLYVCKKRKHNRRSVGTASKSQRKASGEIRPVRASSPLKERRTRGADCMVEPRQTHKANRRSRAPDAVMVTAMQVARRELNLDRKKIKKKQRNRLLLQSAP